MNWPCRGCTKRHPFCHAECEGYKTAAAAYRRDKKKLEEDNQIDQTLCGLMMHRVETSPITRSSGRRKRINNDRCRT